SPSSCGLSVGSGPAPVTVSSPDLSLAGPRTGSVTGELVGQVPEELPTGADTASATGPVRNARCRAVIRRERDRGAAAERRQDRPGDGGGADVRRHAR